MDPAPETRDVSTFNPRQLVAAACVIAGSLVVLSALYFGSKPRSPAETVSYGTTLATSHANVPSQLDPHRSANERDASSRAPAIVSADSQCLFVVRFQSPDQSPVPGVRGQWLDDPEAPWGVSDAKGLLTMSRTSPPVPESVQGKDKETVHRLLCEKDRFEPVVLVDRGVNTSTDMARNVVLTGAPTLLVSVIGLSKADRHRCTTRVSADWKNLLAQEDRELLHKTSSSRSQSFSVRKSSIPSRNRVLWNGLGAKDWIAEVDTDSSSAFHDLVAGIPLTVDVLLDGTVVGWIESSLKLGRGETRHVEVRVAMRQQGSFQLFLSDGRPAAAATVWLSRAMTNRQYCYWGPRGADRVESADHLGRVTFAGLLPGDYYVGFGRASRLPSPIAANGEPNVFVGVRVEVNPELGVSVPTRVSMPETGVIGGVIVSGERRISRCDVLLSSHLVEGKVVHPADADGTFLFHGCIRSPHSITARPHTTHGSASTDAQCDQLDVVLEVQPTERLVLRLEREGLACSSAGKIAVRINRASGIIEHKQIESGSGELLLDLVSGSSDTVVVTSGQCVGIWSQGQVGTAEPGNPEVSITLRPGCVVTLEGPLTEDPVTVHAYGLGGTRISTESLRRGSKADLVVPRASIKLVWTLGDGRTIERAVDLHDKSTATIRCPVD